METEALSPVNKRSESIMAGTARTQEHFDAWLEAQLQGDAHTARQHLSPNARFRSATTAAYEYASADHIEAMERETLPVLENLRLADLFEDGDTRILLLEFTVGGVEAQEVKLVHLDHDGPIDEINAFVRPLPALAAVPALAGPRIARAAGKAGLARQISWTARPIAAVLRKGDASMAPKTDPSRA